MKFLPDLAWSGGVQAQGYSNRLVLDGGAWLVSAAPVTGLVTHLQRTNQFAIHILCKPACGNWPDSRVISISRSPYMPNLNVWQEDQSLAFWFRSPSLARHAQIAFSVPKALAPNELRNIVYSYDGADLSLTEPATACGISLSAGAGSGSRTFCPVGQTKGTRRLQRHLLRDGVFSGGELRWKSSGKPGERKGRQPGCSLPSRSSFRRCSSRTS